MISDEMRRLVSEVRLGFAATVSPAGSPNLSPKGTMLVYDDEHLVFADIRSPNTIANLRENPRIEINVVHLGTRRGYRFKGTAHLVESPGEVAELVRWYDERLRLRPRGHTERFVLVRV